MHASVSCRQIPASQKENTKGEHRHKVNEFNNLFQNKSGWVIGYMLRSPEEKQHSDSSVCAVLCLTLESIHVSEKAS